MVVEIALADQIESELEHLRIGFIQGAYVHPPYPFSNRQSRNSLRGSAMPAPILADGPIPAHRILPA